MKLAILEPNNGQLSIYAIEYCQFKPELFSSYPEFREIFKDQFDVIILSHRMDGFSWLEIYNELKSTKARFIVTSTFTMEDYRGLEPDIYQQLREVRGYKNVHLKLKDEYSKIYDLIDKKSTYMGIRELAMGLLAI